MRNARRTILIAGMLLFLGATPITSAAWNRVLVCIDDRVVVPGPVQVGARMQASAIYAAIGIDIDWQPPSECLQDGIAIELVGDACKGATPTALAHTLPPSAGPQRITVFFNRVKRLVTSQQFAAPAVLGHVLAHEIGHVLLDTNDHSSVGLMQAQWRSIQISLMRRYPLRFSEAEGQMIRARVNGGALSGVTASLETRLRTTQSSAYILPGR